MDLTTKSFSTLKDQCVQLIEESISLHPDFMLDFLLNFPELRLPQDALDLTRRLCRQGALPCLLLNDFQGGILGQEIQLPANQVPSSYDLNVDNLKNFMDSAKENFIIEEADLPKELAYSDDLNELRLMVASLLKILFQYKAINQHPCLEHGHKILLDHGLISDESLFTPREKIEFARKEFLTSEAQFVADMERLSLLMKELVLRKRIGKRYDCLDKLLETHTRLQAELTLDNIASCFLKHVPEITTSHTDFMRSYQEIEQCLRSVTLKVYVHGLPNVEIARSSYLIKPIQRICRYPILFDAIIKYEEDKELDKKAKEEAKRIASKVNAIKDEQDLREKDKEFKTRHRLESRLLLYERIKLNEMLCDAYLYDTGLYLLDKNEISRQIPSIAIKSVTRVAPLVDPCAIKISYLEESKEKDIVLVLPTQERTSRWYRTLAKFLESNTPKMLLKRDNNVFEIIDIPISFDELNSKEVTWLIEGQEVRLGSDDDFDFACEHVRRRNELLKIIITNKM